ncbi:Mov34-domain-containing protein [Linderina pennispora]|uniref:Mov34-domain-containing protein n=1 Tax=Linderina pennispora TaxID=61395 RepID=A0A1Y1W5Y6_9FUNG|nr:Mov34-domain-containing protein [Linderina pennispora]ORX68822.1 Mov34-domain-containing protein [Linderina pennispora]
MSPTALPQCVISPDEYALTEAGERMRPMQIPEDIFEEFIRIAEPNTQQNLETCGVLCGKVVPGQETLVVTTLIIPKQKATSDTCTTENEEELVVTQMQLELLTLGWIHTHPSQTCFMSSLDLHTHFSYQQFMPEAIAIVCSPKYDPRYGVFRLTDPSGMDVIKSCKQEAAFHPHDGSDIIYTNADPDGHVVKARYSFEIIDLRNA